MFVLFALLWATVAMAGGPAVDGVIDVSDADFASGEVVVLDGEWSMWRDQLLAPDQLASAQDAGTMAVPGVWSGAGHATYRLVVQVGDRWNGRPLALSMSNTRATRVWVNGDEVASWGEPDTVPSVAGSYVATPTVIPQDGELVIVAHVANHAHRVGGLRHSLLLGAPDPVHRADRYELARELGLFVLFFTAGFIHVAVWSMRRREHAQLWFGLFCMGQAIRLAATQGLLLFPLEGIWWSVALKVEYLSLYTTLGLGVLMMETLYPEDSTPFVRRSSVAVSALFSAIVLVTPATIYSLTLIVWQLIAVGYVLAICWDLFRSWRNQRPRSGLVFWISVLAAASVVHDSMRYQHLPNLGFDTVYLGLFLFLLVQIYTLGRKYADNYSDVERLSKSLLASNRDLEETNRAVERFVPFEFLNLLDRESIRAIERGDHVSMEMGVLFCDLRGFTSTLEQMTEDEAFDFVNRYLLVMEPAIHEYGGFINAYLGDAIMALFPDGGDSTVRAANAMLEALERFNNDQADRGQAETRIGIGVHTGTLMLGTIGGRDRLDVNVIGDAVNLASRIEGMTKMYGSPVLISESVVDVLRERGAFELRLVDRVVAKGRAEPVAIYEVLDRLDPDEREAKLATRETFESAAHAYREGRIDDALAGFRAVLQAHAQDRAAQSYVARCERLVGVELPSDWDGTERLDHK